MQLAPVGRVARGNHSDCHQGEVVLHVKMRQNVHTPQDRDSQNNSTYRFHDNVGIELCSHWCVFTGCVDFESLVARAPQKT